MQFLFFMIIGVGGKVGGKPEVEHLERAVKSEERKRWGRGGQGMGWDGREGEKKEPAYV